jgi:glycine/D-amino acid oxidase-like deaminating enzyme
LFYACGFSRNGILLAPWAADQVATLVATGSAPSAIAPFTLGRFGYEKS